MNQPFLIGLRPDNFLLIEMPTDLALRVIKGLNVEIEALQGDTVELPHGRVRHEIQLPPEKVALVKKMLFLFGNTSLN